MTTTAVEVAVELVLELVAVELLATGVDTTLASAAAAVSLVGAAKLVASLRVCVSASGIDIESAVRMT